MIVAKMWTRAVPTVILAVILLTTSSTLGQVSPSGSRIYVTDYRNDRIVRVDDMTGAGWTTFGSSGNGVGQFDDPDGIFIDAAGRISVADSKNDRIVRINDMTGAGWTTFGGFGGPNAVFMDTAGRIYVADIFDNRIVWINDMTGAGRIAFGTGGYSVNQLAPFGGPHGIFVDATGRIYAADGVRIVRINDMTGAGWTTFGTFEAASFSARLVSSPTPQGGFMSRIS